MRADELVATSFHSMGTDVTVLSRPADRQAAVSTVTEIFGTWDARFSRFRADSELSRLNRSGGRPFNASEPMIDVIAAAVRAARATAGLFDPTVGPLLVGLGYDRTFDAIDHDAPETSISDWRAGRWTEIEMSRDARWIRLPPGVGLDVGGIAKGMAVDASVAALTSAGISPVAVNAGGDLAVSGSLEGGWHIALDDANDRTVVLHDGALATSSVLRRRWRRGGHEHHHLLDPRTGMPAEGDVVSASVAAASCRAAEVAAKAALLLGPDRAAAFLSARRLGGVLLLRSGEVQSVGEWRGAA